MPAHTVRVNPETHAKLKDLCELTGEPLTVVLDRAVEAYSRQAFSDRCDRAYARLKGDSHSWALELTEREIWDAELADGLDDA